MQKILFIDRDGTLIKETKDEQIDSFEKLEFLPEVLFYLSSIVRETDFKLVMVTNQDGLGTERFPENTFWPVQNCIINTMQTEGIIFDEICIDRTFPSENAPTRKPNTAMLTKYLTGEFDLQNSFVIGDRLTDVELAKNLGCKAIFINHNTYLGTKEISVKQDELQKYISLETAGWKDIYSFLAIVQRKAKVHRKTGETDIFVSLNLDGKGVSSIDSGLSFFNHMLEQISKHSGMDLNIVAKGDLHVDEHHLIEDTAIVLGEALLKALGDKKGIERYGFLLPMDDCLAQVAIDFGGRPWCIWDVKFSRDKIGDVPAEMFFHFFKSFSDAAKCNLNIKAEGENEHHKIEAVFKAFARAIKMAIKRNTKDTTLPSTKGVL